MNHVNVVWATFVVVLAVAASAWVIGLVVVQARRQRRYPAP
jgi:hypothetical protein